MPVFGKGDACDWFSVYVVSFLLSWNLVSNMIYVQAYSKPPSNCSRSLLMSSLTQTAAWCHFHCSYERKIMLHLSFLCQVTISVFGSEKYKQTLHRQTKHRPYWNSCDTAPHERGSCTSAEEFLWWWMWSWDTCGVVFLWYPETCWPFLDNLP